MPPRKDLLRFRVKMAEQAERYDDMVKLITLLAQDADSLTGEERNLLSSAYKNAISSRRTALRAITNMQNRNNNSGDHQVQDLLPYCLRYKTKIEEEIQRLCNDVLEILDSSLIRKSSTPESKVFYEKLKGDYYRYKSEASEGQIKRESEKLADSAYEEAYGLACEKLSFSNSLLLGVALNYSVFLHETKQDQQAALNLCKSTLEKAILHLESGAPPPAADAKRVLQLLRDNATLWSVNVGIVKS